MLSPAKIQKTQQGFLCPCFGGGGGGGGGVALAHQSEPQADASRVAEVALVSKLHHGPLQQRLQLSPLALRRHLQAPRHVPAQHNTR